MPTVRKSRSKSRVKSKRCKALLRRNIGAEMAAYRRGRFVSPKQAVAVAYSLTRKRCGKRWGVKRSRKSGKGKKRMSA